MAYCDSELEYPLGEIEECRDLISRPSSTKISTKAQPRRILNIWAGLIIFVLLGIVAFQYIYIARTSKLNTHSDISQFLPQGQLQQNIFALHTEFIEAPSLESNTAWNNLIPKGKGFVIIEHDEYEGFPPGRLHELQNQEAVVSVFHQLHCLNTLRIGFYSREDVHKDHMGSNHMKHCFDYLRQVIMCSVDTTLEWIPEGGYSTEGWGFQHTCRDYSSVYAWAEEHRSSNATGI